MKWPRVGRLVNWSDDRHTHAESTTESRSGERYLNPFATRHCRTNWRDSTCVGRWGIAPSYNMAVWVPNISRYMRPLLWLCVAKLWARHRSLRWLPHSIHQVHNTSTAHRRQSRNRGHLHGRYEVDDVEGCLPFERRQQTELHRHVESLPAACWMPHRTRRMPTCWLQLRRTPSSWPRPTIPIWSSCYATTQIQMASTCSCSVRHGGQRRRTAPGIPKSPKVSWVLTSATTSCS